MSSYPLPVLDEGRALASFPLYRGHVLESAERSLGDLYAPSDDLLGSIRPVEQDVRRRGISTIAGVRLTHLTLASIRLGERSQLTIGAQNAYHLALPLRGDVWCYFGARKVRMTPGVVAVTQPRDPVLIPSWGDDAEVLCIQIHQGALESELSRLLVRPVGMPTIDGDLDLQTGRGGSWGAALALLLRELADGQGLLTEQHGYGEDLQRLFLAAFLRAMPHEYSSELAGRTAPPRWRSVKKVVEAIEGSPGNPWTLADLARVAGVGSRRLQQGFGEQLGMSPMAYLQAVRFDRVRTELLAGADGVGQTALKLGFTHLGRFSAGYRERFGETPRATQQRARATADGLASRST